MNIQFQIWNLLDMDDIDGAKDVYPLVPSNTIISRKGNA